MKNAILFTVMGLKGRRVHMIEELSETVISLQRAFSTEDHSVPASNSMSSTSSLSTNRIAYSREFLLSCASSPICRTPPENWAKLPTVLSPIIKKEVKYVDPSNYLSAELLWSGIRALSLVEEEEGANNANDA
ncbi:hypothetical protein Avbf_03893 [Armadillidium vulgare]|nr:hypothetical protein Avbf_03893 [Armadillidium vulgare]